MTPSALTGIWPNPTICVPSAPPDLNGTDIALRFEALPAGFDSNNDNGLGSETQLGSPSPSGVGAGLKSQIGSPNEDRSKLAQ